MQQQTSGTSFDFSKIIADLGDYVSNVKKEMEALAAKGKTGGGVDIGTMMNMQMKMQLMSQYVEAMSNTLSALHSSMMTMARATKGQ